VQENESDTAVYVVKYN